MSFSGTPIALFLGILLSFLQDKTVCRFESILVEVKCNYESGKAVISSTHSGQFSQFERIIAFTIFMNDMGL